MNYEKKEKCFTKICSTVLSIVIIALICIDIFCESKVISYVTLVLVFALIIVTFSWSFTSFSIGNLFSMSRTINETKTAVENSAEETRRNFMQLFANINNINQNKNVLNVLLNTNTTEQDKKEIDEANKQETVADKNKIKREALEKFVIQKFMKDKKIKSEILKDVKLQPELFRNNISNRPCFYDAHTKADCEYFLAIKDGIKYSTYFANRLFLMLINVYLYSVSHGVSASLYLIFAYKDREEEKIIDETLLQIKQDFDMAWGTHLLCVEKYEYTE